MVYSPENPLSKYWDRSLQEDMPDSRLSGALRRSSIVYRAGAAMERVFCANCGADGGLVTASWSPHVFYLCDTCAWSTVPEGCIELDESKARGFA